MTGVKEETSSASGISAHEGLQRSRRLAAAFLLVVSSCSTAPPAPETAERSVASSGAPPIARAIECEVAAELLKRAASLLAEGRTDRAERALGDAARRCKPTEAAAKIAASVRAARASSPDDGTRLDVPSPFARRDFAWTHDGQLAVVVGGGAVSVRDGDFGPEIGRYLVPPDVSMIAPLHKRRAVVVADRDAPSPIVIDLETGRASAPFATAMARADSFGTSPDDRLLLVAGDKTLAMYDVGDGTVRATRKLAALVTAWAFDPTSSRLAVVGLDGSVRVLDASSLATTNDLAVREGASEVAFPTATSLVLRVGSELLTLDARSGDPLAEPIAREDCSPLQIGAPRERAVWKCFAYLEAERGGAKKPLVLDTPREATRLYLDFDRVVASPDGSIVWFSISGEQGVVDTVTGKRVSGVTMPAPFLYGARFRPDGRRLGATRVDETAIWTSSLRGDERIVIGRASSLPSAMVLSSRGEVIFARADPVDPAASSMLLTGRVGLDRPSAAGPAAAWSEEPLQLAAEVGRVGVSYRDRLEIRDIASLALSSTIALDSHKHERAFLSPDGARVVVAGDDDLRLLTVADGRERAAWPLEKTANVSVSFSPSGARFVLSGHRGGELVEIGRERQTLGDERGPAGFAGEDVVLVATEGALAVRDLRARTLRSVAGPSAPRYVVGSADGRWAFVAGARSALIDLHTERATDLGYVEWHAGDTAAFVAGGRVLGIARAREEAVEIVDTLRGARIGRLQLTSARGAAYRSIFGSVETFGEGDRDVACVRAPKTLPFATCRDAYLEEGLLARTLRGHGCAAEDVGSLCE